MPTLGICRSYILAGILTLMIAPSVLFAGGGPFNTLVVVNTNSSDSIELGEYYAAKHGIPSHHICHINIATNLITVTSNEFQNQLLTPITNHIAEENLADQIDIIVLCWDFPTRVGGAPHVEASEGVASSLFYGFKNAPGAYDPPNGYCKLPSYTANEYYRRERAFRSADGWNSTQGFVSFHLIASNMVTAKLVVDRGAAAKSSFPQSAVYLYTEGDQNRGVREQRYANTQFSFTALPGLPTSCFFAPLYEIMSGKTNIIGHHDGTGYIHPLVRNNNTWLPGAYADHLTSYGGMIPVPYYSQSTVLDWMEIGATASYGTVAEPCAYLEKFPDPLMGFYYARGFTIGEAYAMAVEAPYQGLFAGDPLAAPFAAPPVVSVTSHVPYQIMTGNVPVLVSAFAHSNGVPAACLDLYLDNRFLTPLVSLGPTPGNRLSIAVSGVTNFVDVSTNDTLFTAVASLANAVNADTNQTVAANATGDRIELIYKQFNHAGDNSPVIATVSQGTASALTLGVGLAATNLIPSIYPARKTFQLYTHTAAGANANDTLTCTLTLTNGVAITNVLVASQGEKVTNILERLRSVILTNETLTATNGVRYDRLAATAAHVINVGAFFARIPGPDGWGIQVDYSVSAVSNNSGLITNVSFSSFLDDYADDLRPRASVLFHVRPTNDILDASTTLATTNLSDGLHTLDFVARDGSAVAAQSRFTLPILVCNTSPQLALLGTNSASITNNEPASLAKGSDFGLGPWNQPRTNIFSILNNGSAPLSITNWTTHGSGAAAFQLFDVPSTIEAGGISNFAVVFAPSVPGAYPASISFDSDAIAPQTNILLAGTAGYTLTLASDYGTPDPAVGSHIHIPNTILTNSITAPAHANGTQLVCTGWAMVGNEPTNGSSTHFTMTVTNDAALTWLWITNYWLTIAPALNGSIDTDNSWQPANITTQITAIANLYFYFTNWSGDVSSTNNPLDLLMDSPKAIQANFAENLATNHTPEWWLAQFGWTNDFDAAALDDAEPDGFPTWQEYIADTDPTNSESVIPPLYATDSTNSLPFGIHPTSTGRHYYIDAAILLDDPAWTNLIHAPGTGGAWLPEIQAPTTGIHFYRGRISLPP